MAKLQDRTGALVRYCGHNACFPADIRVIEGAVVVRASGPVLLDKVDRSPESVGRCTHHLVDFPSAGFWRPDLGVFVVPENQCKEIKSRG